MAQSIAVDASVTNKRSANFLSSGISSLDSLFGGGIAFGKLIIIEEDAHNLYSSLVVKYFLAEGVLSGDRICLLAEDFHLQNIMNELPAEGVTKEAPNISDADKLDIAWRYAKVSGPGGRSESSRAYAGHRFDLSRTLDSAAYVSGPLFHRTAPPPPSDSCSCEAACGRSLDLLRAALAAAAEPSGPPTRVALPGLGSPCWGSGSGSGGGLRPELTRFLLRMRAHIGAARAAGLVTVPQHVLEENPGLRERIFALADYAITLESFAGSEKEANPVYKDYRGSFQVKKIPCVNSNCPISRPDTLDLAFKVRTQNFIIEPLYLPPDLSETASRSVTRGGDVRASQGCGSGSKSKLDF